MIVQLATRADLPEICRISNWAIMNTTAHFNTTPDPVGHWEEEWSNTHERFPWLVALDEGVVGFAKASPHRGRCAYAWSAEVTVYVDPLRHGSGVGRALYGRLIPFLRAQGFQTLIAGITLPNPASVGLHERFGFRRAGVFERIGWKFDAWRDVGYWQLCFEPPVAPPPPLRRVSEIA